MKRFLTYAQAISEATVQGMDRDPQVFVMGLGVDDHKGIFSTTKEAYRKYGRGRVMGIPASENAMTGVAIGTAINGKRPIFVHARNDFMFLALDQIMNNASKWMYNFCGTSQVPIVVRGIIGKGWGQGPTHSQSIQSVFSHFPGVFVAMPSSPYIAKGILLKSLAVNVPVILLEHRSLYDLKEEVPSRPYTFEFGKAKVFRTGKDITIVAVSVMVREAIKAADLLKRHGISVEVVDPVSLSPLDENTIIRSVKKTGRLICADTSWRCCSFASEVAAVVAEKAFSYLKGPVQRIHVGDCPAPVSEALEKVYYPDYSTIMDRCCRMLKRPLISERLDTADEKLFTGPY